MARIIGNVKAIESGKFFVKDGQGHVNVLKVGDVIHEGEHVYGAQTNMKNASIMIDVVLAGAGDLVISGNGELQFDATLLAGVFSHHDAVVYVNSVKEAMAMAASAEGEKLAAEDQVQKGDVTTAGDETAAGDVLTDTERLGDVFAGRTGAITDVTTNVNPTAPSVTDAIVDQTEVVLLEEDLPVTPTIALSTSTVMITEDGSGSFSVTATTNGNTTDELKAVNFTNLPSGWTVAVDDGTANGAYVDGVYTPENGAQSVTLTVTLTPPTDTDRDVATVMGGDIQVTATAADLDGTPYVTTPPATIDVNVDAVLDAAVQVDSVSVTVTEDSAMQTVNVGLTGTQLGSALYGQTDGAPADANETGTVGITTSAALVLHEYVGSATLNAVSGGYTLTGWSSLADLESAIEHISAQVPAGFDGPITGTVSVSFNDPAVDSGEVSGNNVYNDTASFSVTVTDDDVTPTIALSTSTVMITEDGSGSFSVTATTNGNTTDELKAVNFTNLPSGWTVAVDDGTANGAYVDGVYTPENGAQSVTLTVTLTPPTDTDRDVATVMGGDIQVTATAADLDGTPYVTTPPATIDVNVDAVLDAAVQVDSVSVTVTEDSAMQTVNVGLTGTQLGSALYGQTDGAPADANETGTVGITTSAALVLHEYVGSATLNAVSGGYTLTGWSSLADLESAIEHISAQVPAGFDGPITGTVSVSFNDPAVDSGEVSGNNVYNDTASFSVTVTDDDVTPTIALSTSTVMITEDGSGSFSVTATTNGNTTDELKAVNFTNLPSGWTVAVDDGTANGAYVDGVYTPENGAQSVTLTVTLTPPTDTDRDVATVMGGDIQVTATAADLDGTPYVTTPPATIDVNVDAVLDAAVQVDSVSVTVTEDSAMQTVNVGLTGTQLGSALYGQTDGAPADANETGTVGITTSAALVLHEYVGSATLNAVSGGYTLTGWSSLADLESAIEHISAQVPAGFDGPITGTVSVSFNDPAVDSGEVSGNNVYNDTASFSVTVTDDDVTPTIALSTSTVMITEDGSGSFSVTATTNGNTTDELKAVNFTNLPSGWTVAVDDGTANGAYVDGVYTPENGAQSVTLTVTLTPPTDTDRDVATVMGGDIQVTATAADLDGTPYVTTPPATIDVNVDAVLDAAVQVDSVSVTVTEDSAMQTVNVGLTGTQLGSALYGQTDGAPADANETGTVGITTSAALVLHEYVGSATLNAVSGGYTLTGWSSLADLESAIEHISAQVPAGFDGPITGTVSVSFNDPAVDSGEVSGNNVYNDTASFSVTVTDDDVTPTIALSTSTVMITEDGSGSFSVTATTNGNTTDELKAVNFTNLPSGWTVAVDDGTANGAYVDGVYTPENGAQSVTLTVTLTPPTDTDRDVATVMGGDIQVTATAADLDGTPYVTTPPATIDVNVDAVLDAAVQVDSVSVTVTEDSAMQTVNVGLTGTQLGSALYGQTDGAPADANETGTVGITTSAALVLHEYVGSATLNAVSGGYTLTGWSSLADLESAIEHISAQVPAGFDGPITGTVSVSFNDPAVDSGEVSGNNVYNDTASFSVTVTDDDVTPTIALSTSTVMITEDGSGSFSVTATTNGNTTDELKAVNFTNLPSGWTVAVDDGTANGAYVDGVYTPENGAQSVTLTVTLTPPTDTDRDVATVMGGDIQVTATAADLDGTPYVTTPPATIDVNVDAVLDAAVQVDSVSVTVTEDSAMQTVNVGLTGTQLGSALYGQTDGAPADANETGTVGITTSAALVLHEYVGSATLNAVSGGYTLTGWSSLADLESAIEHISAQVPAGFDGPITGTVSVSFNDPAVDSGEVSGNNVYNDTASFSVTVTPVPNAPTLDVTLVGPDITTHTVPYTFGLASYTTIGAGATYLSAGKLILGLNNLDSSLSINSGNGYGVNTSGEKQSEGAAQIDTSGTQREALILNFDDEVTSATIKLKHLAHDDPAQWEAYDSQGNLVGSGSVDVPLNDANLLATVTPNIVTDATMQYIVFLGSVDGYYVQELEGGTITYRTYSYNLNIIDATLTDTYGETLGDVIVTGLPAGAILTHDVYDDITVPQSGEVHFGSDTDETTWTMVLDDVLPSNTSIVASLTSTESNGESAVSVVGVYGDNVIVGSSGPDYLDGRTGNDTLTGGDGNDTLLGGLGDDTLIADMTDSVIDGGLGTDTLIIAGNTGINFTALSANPISNIEVIDLTLGNHELTNISLSDVVNMTDSNSDVYILGDSLDKVDFLDSDGWAKSVDSVTATVNGVEHDFYTYTNVGDTDVTVKVQVEIVDQGI